MDLDRFARDFGRHRRQSREAPCADSAPSLPDGPAAPAATPTPTDDIAELPPWLEAREERAAIMEFDGGLPRDEAERQAAALHPDPGEPPPAPAAPITCGTCRHFAANLISPEGGLGHCRIEAPASRNPPALWPGARHYCRNHQPPEEPV